MFNSLWVRLKTMCLFIGFERYLLIFVYRYTRTCRINQWFQIKRKNIASRYLYTWITLKGWLIEGFKIWLPLIKNNKKKIKHFALIICPLRNACANQLKNKLDAHAHTVSRQSIISAGVHNLRQFDRWLYKDQLTVLFY